jgi:hypothetical protein
MTRRRFTRFTKRCRPRKKGTEDALFTRAAWLKTAQGVSRLYKVYALGEKPPTAKIDDLEGSWKCKKV